MASSESCSSVETLQPVSPKQEPDQDPDPALQNQDGRDEDEEEDEGVSSGGEPELQNQEPLDSEWVEESFRIDRKKLELMLYGVCLF